MGERGQELNKGELDKRNKRCKDNLKRGVRKRETGGRKK